MWCYKEFECDCLVQPWSDIFCNLICRQYGGLITFLTYINSHSPASCSEFCFVAWEIYVLHYFAKIPIPVLYADNLYNILWCMETWWFWFFYSFGSKCCRFTEHWTGISLSSERQVLAWVFIFEQNEMFIALCFLTCMHIL